MKPSLLKLAILSAAFVSIQSIYAQCELSTLDFDDPSGFSFTCGNAVGFWIVLKEQDCTLTFTEIILPGDSTVDGNIDIPISHRIHPAGSCGAADSCFLSYSINGGPFVELNTYLATHFKGVEMVYDTIKNVATGSTLRTRVQFKASPTCTDWKLQEGSCGGRDVPKCSCLSWPLETGTTNIFSPFGTLPITLISFEGRIIEDEIKFTWITSMEINNDFFTVERSTNGIFYDEIAKVDAVGNSTLNTSYEAWDEFPVEGSAYYRLIQTDEDGGSEYAATISLKFDPEAGVEGEVCKFDIRPSPCPSQCNLNLSGCTNSDFISIGLYDVVGRRINSTIPVRQGNGFFLNTRNNLAPGTYIVMGSTGREKVSQKIIVQ